MGRHAIGGLDTAAQTSAAALRRFGSLTRGCAVAVLFVLAGCGSGPEPLGLRATPNGLELVTECARELSADVAESASEIRIENVGGVVLDGDDCEGILPLELRAPIGDRAVVVENRTWVRLPESCPWGTIGPASTADRLDSCAADAG